MFVIKAGEVSLEAIDAKVQPNTSIRKTCGFWVKVKRCDWTNCLRSINGCLQ